jgi:hypothetical protein
VAGVSRRLEEHHAARGPGRQQQPAPERLGYLQHHGPAGRRHLAGDGATLDLRVREEGEALTFEVTDDGQGFEPTGRGLGAGFVNMEDRLRALRGSMRVESAPGQGTSVTGTLPVRAALNVPGLGGGALVPSR